MTTEDPGRETRLIEIKGRQVVVRQLRDAQMVLLMREAQLVQRDDVENRRKLVAIGRLMDVLESAIVQPEDRDYLTNLNVAGDLELGDLFGVIKAFGEEKEPAKPVVRRGRPRKTPV